MDLFSAIKVSSSGLSVQRTRMNIIASNLANVNTTRTSEGGPYKKKSAVIAAITPFNGMLKTELSREVKGVKVVSVQDDQSQPKLVFEPSHPDADDRGYVAYPNISSVEEMVSMLSATRSYEANITVINSIKSMAVKALELGR